MADESRFTTEYRARVYHDDHGYYVEVREDPDGLGLCEIAYNDGGGQSKDQVVNIGTWEMAVAVAKAILAIHEKRAN